MARILIGNIKGPKGDTGAQGPQGATGPQGPQGPLPPLVNNALATEAGVAALDAVMGKTLQEQITNNKNDITELNSEMITITTKDYEVTLTSSGRSSWGYSYGFSLVENGDLPTRTQLVIPIACGLKANWNTTGMVSVHQNDFVRVASNTGGIFDLRLAFISRRAPD